MEIAAKIRKNAIKTDTPIIQTIKFLKTLEFFHKCCSFIKKKRK